MENEIMCFKSLPFHFPFLAFVPETISPSTLSHIPKTFLKNLSQAK